MIRSMKNGYFVISLDFEIYWGVRDVVALEKYKENLLGVRKAIPGMLDLFSKYHINATFATVGFLFFENKSELLNSLPSRKPEYGNSNLSPYNGHFDIVGNDEKEDPFHFGPSLIRKIKESNQEIGCHTFSHYYCLEPGQTIEDFREDLRAAKKIAAKNNIELKSFVFPRNQCNEAYLNICKEEGIIAFRGNEHSNVLSSNNYYPDSSFRRMLRLFDTYINISGHNGASPLNARTAGLTNIPASRFLRPYSPKLSILDGLRLKRITRSMTHAAKNNLIYHLWWHPHNFGINTNGNLLFLEKILIHYKELSDKYGFKSTGMAQLAELLTGENGK